MKNSKNYLISLFRGILFDQAEKIDNEEIKDSMAIKTWYWISKLPSVFLSENEEMKKLGYAIGKIIAYRMQNDKEFKEKVIKLIKEAQEITKE